MKSISNIVLVCLIAILLHASLISAASLKLKIERYDQRLTHNRGKMYVNGVFANIYTMEQPWKYNWPMQSCLQVGNYTLNKIINDYFIDYDHLKIKGTGRSDYNLIRRGEDFWDLVAKSHVLLGKSISNNKLTNTRTAMDELMAVVNSANWDSLDLEIAENY